ncbi:hypothetical protein GCM10020000_47660 [Streptomyces olivoverticillatus]
MSTTLDLTRAIWEKSSYSEGNGGACVEWAPECAASGVVPVRDSKNPPRPRPDLPRVVLVGVRDRRPERSARQPAVTPLPRTHIRPAGLSLTLTTVSVIAGTVASGVSTGRLWQWPSVNVSMCGWR